MLTLFMKKLNGMICCKVEVLFYTHFQDTLTLILELDHFRQIICVF